MIYIHKVFRSSPSNAPLMRAVIYFFPSRACLMKLWNSLSVRKIKWNMAQILVSCRNQRIEFPGFSRNFSQRFIDWKIVRPLSNSAVMDKSNLENKKATTSSSYRKELSNVCLVLVLLDKVKVIVTKLGLTLVISDI